MPEAAQTNILYARRSPTGKLLTNTPACERAADVWGKLPRRNRRSVSRQCPVPENVVKLVQPTSAFDWPCPPHVMAMMHVVLQLEPEAAKKVAGQLAAIYALSGDAFTDMTIGMLETVK